MSIPRNAIHVLDPRRHQHFLAEKRLDAFTQAPFATGDEIVVCDSCGSAHLVESWLAAGASCCGCKNPTLSSGWLPSNGETVHDFSASSRKSSSTAPPVTTRSGAQRREPRSSASGLGKFFLVLGIAGLLWAFFLNRGKSTSTATSTPQPETPASTVQQKTVDSAPLVSTPPLNLDSPPVFAYTPPYDANHTRLKPWPSLTIPRIPDPPERIAVIDDNDGETRLRERPSAGNSSRILAYIPTTERVTVLQELSDGWLRVQRQSGETGYIFENNCKLENGTAYSRMNAFLQEHHAKASRKELEGVVADYAAEVNYFGSARRSRAQIKNDEAPYFQNAAEIRETLASVPEGKQLRFGLFEFRYNLDVYRVLSNGSSENKTVRVIMHLRHYRDRIEIVLQRHD